MTRTRAVARSCAAIVCSQLLIASLAGTEPLAMEAGVAQLFIDDHVLESSPRVIRTLHQPVKDHVGNQPLIRAPRDGTLLAYGSIVFDSKLNLYVMFLQSYPTRSMYRVTSSDGLNWSQYEESTLERLALDMNLGNMPRDRANNAHGERGIDLFSCHYDEDDSAWPYKGWCWFANWGNDLEGIYYIRSRDGRSWERGPQVVNGFAGHDDPSCRAIEQDGHLLNGPGDVTLFAYDAPHRRYLGIFKFFSEVDVGRGNNLRSRAYLWLDRLDQPVDTKRIEQIALLPPGADQNGDTAFDEYYASTAWRYESLWLGTLKIFHARGDYPHSAAGCAFFKLAVSRDALNWRKVQFTNDAGIREVFLPNGREGGKGGQNDGGYMSDFSQGPLRIGDELIFYYSSSSWGKNHQKPQRLSGGGIFRARLRVDGFVSIDEGVATTRPLILIEVKNLFVNAIGPVKVEALNEAGRVLASTNIKTDSIKQLVTFDGKSLGEITGESNPRLRFTVRPPGKLYSFTIR